MSYREKYEQRRAHEEKMCLLKVLIMWLVTMIEVIIATLIVFAYPVVSGILYALAGENLFRMAEFYDEEEEDEWQQ